MKTIGIFTPYPNDPVHPRTLMLFQILKEAGFGVAIVSTVPKPQGRSGSGVIYAGTFFKKIRYLRDFDIIFIQGFRNLWLSVFAKRNGKRIIYETLDSSPALYEYYLKQRWSFLGCFGWARFVMEKYELFLSRKYAHAVIVNSAALKTYFEENARLIYYSSPLENACPCNNPSNEIAFIYLGWFCKMKGAEGILGFLLDYPYKLFIFGDITENDIREKVTAIAQIKYSPALGSNQLIAEIRGLMSKYFLIGLSCTREVNLSNATQEINKDIDYLACGIPIFGNHRIPTAEKIQSGCGFFMDDASGVRCLLNDADLRKKMTERCIVYCQERYARGTARDQILRVITDVESYG